MLDPNRRRGSQLQVLASKQVRLCLDRFKFLRPNKEPNKDLARRPQLAVEDACLMENQQLEFASAG